MTMMKSLYNLLLSVCCSSANSELIQWLYHENCIVDNYRQYNRAYSLTWPASMQIYGNKKNFLHKKRVQLPQDLSGTPKWLPFHCFGTPISWPLWCHVNTLYSLAYGYNSNRTLISCFLVMTRHYFLVMPGHY